ncbi:MAG: hypothetical protein MHMPM18_004224 [Marteilia pararefringens]
MFLFSSHQLSNIERIFIYEDQICLISCAGPRSSNIFSVISANIDSNEILLDSFATDVKNAIQMILGKKYTKSRILERIEKIHVILSTMIFNGSVICPDPHMAMKYTERSEDDQIKVTENHINSIFVRAAKRIFRA